MGKDGGKEMTGVGSVVKEKGEGKGTESGSVGVAKGKVGVMTGKGKAISTLQEDQSQLSRPRLLRHLILDFSDGRDIKPSQNGITPETGEKIKWHRPFCEGWRPVVYGTPTHPHRAMKKSIDFKRWGKRRATPASGRDQKSIDFQLNSLRKISF